VLGPELGAQPTDVHVDGASTSVIVVTPYLPQQKVSVANAARSLREELQQLEFLVSEVERPTAHIDLIVLGIDGQVADLQNRSFVTVATLSRR
jgi:hypothetical protein